MNLARWCVESQVGGEYSPWFLEDDWPTLWSVAYWLQPWTRFYFSPSLFRPFIASGITAVVYLSVWALVFRLPVIQRLNARLRTTLLAVLFATVTLPYLAMFAYALYVWYAHVPPPPAV